VAPGDSPPDARAVAAAFRSLLSSAEHPLLVPIHDAHWLDPASPAAIDFAIRRVKEPIGLLATRRPGSALDAVLAGTRPLALEPLSLAAIHHIVRNKLGTTAPRPLLTRVHETAGGNPFYALQVARATFAAEVPAGAPLPVPDDLSALLLERIESVAPETREVLLTVSAAATPTRPLLEALHGEVAQALEEGEDAGLLDDDDLVIRFAHPLYAAAMYSSVGHEHRRRVHAALATVVEATEEQARHLALSAVPPDEETAVRIHAAAREVGRRGAPIAAVDLLEHALRLGEESSKDKVSRLVDLGRYLHASGNSIRAGEVLQEIESWNEQTTDVQVDGLWTLGDAAYWTAGGKVPVDVCERLLEGLTDPLVRAAVLGKVASYLEHDMARGLELAETALALLEPLGDEADPRVVALALGMRARNRLALGLGLDRDSVERANQLYPTGETPRSYGQWLKYVDEFDESRRWLEDSYRYYEETGDDVSFPNVLQQLAMTECWAGNLSLAAEHAERACVLADEMEITGVGPYRIRAVVEAYRGNEPKVREIAQHLEDQGWQPAVLQHVQVALGLLELSLGNLEAADLHLRRAIELAEEMGQLEPGVHRVHGDAAEAAIALGDRARAEQIAELLDEHGRRTDHRWSAAVAARTRALLHADQGDFDAALEAIDEALAVHDRLPMPYELGRTLLAKGQIERRALHRRDARESLSRSEEIFEEIGAKLWAARVADELRRIPIRRAAGDELTDGERRVAQLVASGMTNKEVAHVLFISPKTVEANLSRVYGKLGISSRAELGARIATGS
jgi:DNA-binding NarL/FixJ family response regulator